jgi:hypothetical protein
MGFPTISGQLATIAAKFGGDVMNLIQQFLSGIDIAASDSTNKPIINTETRWRSGKLRFQDASTPTRREIDITLANQGGTRTVHIPALTDALQELVFAIQAQRIYNKTLDADDGNDFANIPQSAIDGFTSVLLGAQNVGTGQGQVLKDVNAQMARLRTIKAGSSVTVTNNTDDITITANPAGIGGFLPLVAEVPSSTQTGLSYIAIGGSSASTTLTNRTIEVGMDLKVTAVRARVQTNSTNGSGLQFGIVDDGVVIATVAVAAGATGYFENELSSPVTIAAGSMVAISVNHLGSSGTYEARPVSIEIVSGSGAIAHKATHVAGGTDAFAKNDNINAAARYLEDSGDPSSDAQRIWMVDGGLDIKYWTDQGSPTMQTLERIANRNVNNGYCGLDGSAKVPTAQLPSITSSMITDGTIVGGDIATNTIQNDRLQEITDKGKLQSQIQYDWSHNKKGWHNLTSSTGAGGIWDGHIVSTGTYTNHSSTSTNWRGRWATAASTNAQAGFRTDIHFIKGNHSNPTRGYALDIEIFIEIQTQFRAFFGLTGGHTGGFPTGGQSIGTWSNNMQLIGVWIDEGATQGATNWRKHSNDASGASPGSDISPATPSDVGTGRRFIITYDEGTPSWNIIFEGTNNIISSDIPVGSSGALGLLCYIETKDNVTKSFDLHWCQTSPEPRL